MPEYNDEGFGWLTIKAGSHAHVVPLNDEKEHLIGDQKCWCNPEFDEEHNMIIHNAADGRPDFDRKLRKFT